MPSIVSKVKIIDDERLISGIPNTRLVVILVVIMGLAVAGSLFGFFNDRITGMATTGTVQVTITALSSLTVNSNVNFGNSSISTTSPNTEVSSETADNYATFNNCTGLNGGLSGGDTGRDCTGMEVENDGNVNINVTMYSSVDADGLYTGTSGGAFRYAVLDGNRTKNETEFQIMGTSYHFNTFQDGNLINVPCRNNVGSNVSIQPQGSTLNSSFINWTTIPTSAALICGNLSWGNMNDTITVEFNLTLPLDEPTGTRSATITFTAAQV